VKGAGRRPRPGENRSLISSICDTFDHYKTETMRLFFLMACTAALLTACGSKGGGKATFCDTTCQSDSFKFVGNNRFESMVNISVRNCEPDSVSWTHGGMAISRLVPMSDLVREELRLNKAAVSCVIKDTSYAWLTFNNCLTGRGYLVKLPFNNVENITKISGAINSFDPKFAVDPSLRAYTDRGSIFVVDVDSGKENIMTFKESYDIDFDKIHEVIDSVNVTRSRIYVKLIKNGQPVELEKKVEF
jgi:hypothetical protein